MSEPTAEQKQNQAQMTLAGMALLHRLVKAAGGRMVIPLAEVPTNFAFDFQVVDGVAVFTALKPAPSSIVPAPAAALGRLKHFNGGR